MKIKLALKDNPMNIINLLMNKVGSLSVSLAPKKPPMIEKKTIQTTYDQMIKPLNTNTLTEIEVIKKDKRDLTADICLIENSFPKESTDSNAIPRPPLK